MAVQDWEVGLENRGAFKLLDKEVINFEEKPAK